MAQLIQRNSDGKNLAFQYNDGGRSQYFKAQKVGDCVTRAFSIASGKDYKEVYNLIFKTAKETPRNGVKRTICKKIAKQLGGIWHPLMGIGTGCKAHLRVNEVPMKGKIVCSVSKHLTAVIDGVINDTYDCGRDGERCVYGYWEFK